MRVAVGATAVAIGCGWSGLGIAVEQLLLFGGEERIRGVGDQSGAAAQSECERQQDNFYSIHR